MNTQVQTHLPQWIQAVTEWLVADYHRRLKVQGYEKVIGSQFEEPPYLSIGGGRKYIQIFDQNGSIFAFVRASDGAILKPASRKRPMLNHIRGSIFDPNLDNALTPNGVRYISHLKTK